MIKDKEKEKKEDMLEIKNVDEEDYRGLLALLLVGGFLALIAICIITRQSELIPQLTAVLAPLVSAVVTAYFLKRREENNRAKNQNKNG